MCVLSTDIEIELFFLKILTTNPQYNEYSAGDILIFKYRFKIVNDDTQENENIPSL